MGSGAVLGMISCFFFLSFFTRPHVEFLVAVQLTAKVMINQQWDLTVNGFITGNK